MMQQDQRTDEASPAHRPGEPLVIARVLDARPRLVFRAWTEPDRLRCWWGPKGFTSPVARVDLRVGGRYLFAMRSPGGRDFWSTGVYREIVEPNRIVATDSFSDAESAIAAASRYGASGARPPERLLTITFDGVDGRTRLTLRHAGLPAGAGREAARRGWNESLDKLAAFLAGVRPSR